MTHEIRREATRLPPRPLLVRTAVLAALTALVSVASVWAADPLTLEIPGQPDKAIAPEMLLGKGSMDVRLEDVQGNVTVYHGMPLLDVLEKNGLDVRTMAGERKSAAAVVLVRARDGYTVAFTVGELRNNRANPKVFLVAETAEGPLPGNEGPVRAVTYGDPVRSPYALSSIELRTLAENPAQKK
ncbi:MAG TPA: hypothetical protein VH854_04925 [Thermoanaerobaculia bacterium]|nr:hypothetical protein [Thermoanaerobaculia bacterium]